MGDVMNGCTFPGRMISWAGVVLCGDTTDTAVRATCNVSVRSFALAPTRDRIPYTSSAAVTIRAIDNATHCLYECFRAPATLGWSACPSICFTSPVSGDIVAPYGGA